MYEVTQQYVRVTIFQDKCQEALLTGGQQVGAWNGWKPVSAKAAQCGHLNTSSAAGRKNLKFFVTLILILTLILNPQTVQSGPNSLSLIVVNQSVPRRASMGKPARDEEESEEIEIKDFDDVLKHIGGWGPFQVSQIKTDYSSLCGT